MHTICIYTCTRFLKRTFLEENYGHLQPWPWSWLHPCPWCDCNELIVLSCCYPYRRPCLCSCPDAGLRFLATSVFIVIFSWCCISGVSCELFTNLTWPANHTLPTGTYGCYGDNATNKMADDGDCRFVFQVSVGGSGSEVIQNSSSPWLTASFRIQQNHGQVFCQPLQCSVQATAVIYTLNVTCEYM